MSGVENRVALVTGAGRGIGRATVELLTARGARVMAAARSEQELAELGVDYVVADLSTEEGCDRAVSETEQRLGTVEILVCNHGLGSAHEVELWKQEVATWEESLRVNLDGPFFLARRVLGPMVENGYGRCVFTSSTAAEVAEHAGSADNAAKRGLIGLSNSVAADGGPFGVTSNSVLPGWVRTEMAERSARADAERRGITPEEVWAERASHYPPGRVATPQEVAEVIAFFAAEESSGVSGETLKVALGGLL